MILKVRKINLIPNAPEYLSNMNPPAIPKNFKPKPSASMNFESWMEGLGKESLSSQNQALLLKGLEEHPEWAQQVDQFQQAPLMRALEYGNIKIVQVLIQAGADLNVQDRRDGKTALMKASIEGYMEVVKTLIQAGADLNIQSKDGRTALIFTSANGFSEAVQVLIRAGASLNLQDEEGCTALMWASYYGCDDVAKTLIQAGADMSLQDQNGWTALMYASCYSHLEVVKTLIQQGADPKVLNKGHKTAWDLAKRNGNHEVMSYLEAHAASQVLNQVITPVAPSSPVGSSSKKATLSALKNPRL